MNSISKKLENQKYNLLKKYKSVKELDLEYLIDNEKSGNYFIHPIHKFLEFKYQSVYRFVPDDYKLIYGDMKIDSDYIEIIPSVDERFKDSKKRVRVLIDKPFSSKDYDFINISFERSFESAFFVGLFDKFSRDLDMEFFSGTDNLASYTSPQCDILYFNFEKDLLKMIRRIALAYMKDTLVQEKCLDKNIDCLISISDGFIQINNGRPIYNKLILRDKEKYFTYGYHPGDKSEINGKVIDITLGRKQGYIYLKPIKTEFQKYNIFGIYSGNPSIQYYNHKKSRWLDINNSSKIELSSDINLRVAMNYHDRIYNMYVGNEEA